MKFLLLFIFFSCLLSCASNKTSEVVRNESVELNLSYETDSLNQQTILGIPLADRVIDFSVKTIGSVLEKEAAKYKASYFASKVGKDFYETKVINGKENCSLKYNTLEIVRKAGIPQEKVANIQFKFEFDESGYFFRLRPHYIKIDKTKAKRNLKDETIDLIIDVTLFVTKRIGAHLSYGRLPGWIAQWREMRLNKEPIGRPRQIYTGENAREFKKVEKR